MRRLLALGMGCLIGSTAYAEDLLTIFDQAVVNDPLVREAEFTRKATREARHQAWAAYLPQIGGSWSKTDAESSGTSIQDRLVNYPNTGNFIIQSENGGGDTTFDQTDWGVQLRQSVFN